MKEKNTFEKIIEILFGLVLLVQIFFLFKFNLSDIRESLDADFSYTVYHYLQVMKSGTINLLDWNHTSTLELDATFLFALPLCYLVKDVFRAVGISNLIIAFLYILILYKLLSLCKVRHSIIYMVITLVLTPYAFGMLEYFNMMFYGGACYSIKVLVPFIAVLLILWKKSDGKKGEKIAKILTWFLYLILLFVTTFSTGVYVALCGLTPIIISVCLDIWKDGTLKGKYGRQDILLLGLSVLDFAVAIILHNQFYGLISRNGLSLTKYVNWDANLRACLIAPFQVLGTTTNEDIRATSILGMFLLVKVMLVGLLLFVAIRHLPSLFKRSEEIQAEKIFTLMFFFNFLLLLLADCRYAENLHIEYRYLLIGIVPLFPLFGIWIDRTSRNWNSFQLNCVFVLLLGATAFVVAGNNNNIVKNWDRTKYAIELSDYVSDMDVESVFVVDDIETVAYLRAMNLKQKYGCYNSDMAGLELTICSEKKSQYATFYGHKNAIAIFNYRTMESYFGEDFASHYTYYGTVRWFDIYVADEVYF